MHTYVTSFPWSPNTHDCIRTLWRLLMAWASWHGPLDSWKGFGRTMNLLPNILWVWSPLSHTPPSISSEYGLHYLTLHLPSLLSMVSTISHSTFHLLWVWSPLSHTPPSISSEYGLHYLTLHLPSPLSMVSTISHSTFHLLWVWSPLSHTPPSLWVWSPLSHTPPSISSEYGLHYLTLHLPSPLAETWKYNSRIK